MAIKVTCPNGHVLEVKEKYAGQSGLCPHCRARVQVPKVQSVSEDDVLAILGPPKPPPPPLPPPSEEFVHQEPRHDETKEESGISLLGSALLRRKKACPQCGDIISFAFTVCPRCGTRLSAATAPLPEETPKQSSIPVYHYLGVRKHGDVMIVRFGEHRITDEVTVGRIAQELDSVADRADCYNLLVNFVSVVDLSKLMLEKLLSLQKKIEQKGGTLKLCQTGFEIQRIFADSKVGQSFDIQDNERNALNTFPANLSN